MTEIKEYNHCYHFNEGFTDIKQLEDMEIEIVKYIKDYFNGRLTVKTRNKLERTKLEEDIKFLVDFVPIPLEKIIQDDKVLIKCSYSSYMGFIYGTSIKEKMNILEKRRKGDLSDLKRMVYPVINMFEKNIKRFENFISYCSSKHKHNIPEQKYYYFYSIYTNKRTYISIYCEIHGFYPQKAGDHKNSMAGCTECSTSGKRYSLESVAKILGNKNITTGSEYKNSGWYMNLECIICGHLWSATFHRINIIGTGCPKCSGNAKHTYAYVKMYLKTINIELLSKEYNNGRVHLNLKCMKCAREWPASFDSIHNAGSGCPRCNNTRSKGEEMIKKYLTDSKKDFTHPKKFPDLGLLSYDFFCMYLQEFDGEQHFNFIDRFHKSDKDFKDQLERDERKNNYAFKNNHSLIRISYLCRKESDIKDILDGIYSKDRKYPFLKLHITSKTYILIKKKPNVIVVQIKVNKDDEIVDTKKIVFDIYKNNVLNILDTNSIKYPEDLFTMNTKSKKIKLSIIPDTEPSTEQDSISEDSVSEIVCSVQE